jgi:hypothetical protein
MEMPMTIQFDDGVTRPLVEFDSFIEYVHIPWNGCVDEQLDKLPKRHDGMEEAVMTSLLVVPDQWAGSPDELGTIEFYYNERLRFGAPVVALMDRYHGLRSLQGLLDRFRLLIDPSAKIENLMRDGFGPTPKPIHVRALLNYELRHVGGPRGNQTSFGSFTVEVQGLIKRQDRKGLFTR